MKSQQRGAYAAPATIFPLIDNEFDRDGDAVGLRFDSSEDMAAPHDHIFSGDETEEWLERFAA